MLKAKSSCCKDKPRCKRCPVVCKRLEESGHLTRVGKRKWIAESPIPKKALHAARS